MLYEIQALEVGMYINSHVFFLFEVFLQYLLERSMPEEGEGKEEHLCSFFSSY
jgi:hypothetical protein